MGSEPKVFLVEELSTRDALDAVLELVLVLVLELVLELVLLFWLLTV